MTKVNPTLTLRRNLACSVSRLRRSGSRAHREASQPSAVQAHDDVPSSQILRPRCYPIRSTVRALNLPINGNLHSSDQLPHGNLHIVPLSRHPPVVFLPQAAPAVAEWLWVIAGRTGDQN